MFAKPFGNEKGFKFLQVTLYCGILIDLTSQSKRRMSRIQSRVSQPAVNFINVKRTNFSYEHRILAAFSSYMYIEK